ncbi:MAG: YhcH/YjgK/YiaL family protein [Candidatus Gastranaerophilales bacterium]|nr:YhcH/YjgK/YiaL family protein [Candidatus Gastranaerophilales bacterium]
MIIDNLTNAEKYISLHKDFKLVFDFLKTNNLTEMSCGKNIQIRGEEVFFNLDEYETKQTQKLEAHKKYIDIQVVITGEEYMGYTNIENTTVSEEYDEKRDVMFLNGRVDKILATNQNFLIFYPEDAHMPALSVTTAQKVKKAIFKIKK